MKALYINRKLADADDKTIIALIDSSQPFNDLFAVSASRSNTFRLPNTPTNQRIFDALEIPNSETSKRYEKFHVIYIQEGIELISDGVGYVNKAQEDGYDIVVFSSNADLFSALNRNNKSIQDLDFNNLNFNYNDSYVYYFFKAQYDNRANLKFFFPLICYRSIEKIPPLQRNTLIRLNANQYEQMKSFLSTSFGIIAPAFFNDINYLPLFKYPLFPAVRFHEIIKRIISQNGYTAIIPSDLLTETAIVPFSNDSITLTDVEINAKRQELTLSSYTQIPWYPAGINGGAAYNIPFNSLSNGNYSTFGGYNFFAFRSSFTIDIEFTCYTKSTAKMIIDQGSTRLKEYLIPKTYTSFAEEPGVPPKIYRGVPYTIKDSFEFDTYENSMNLYIYMQNTAPLFIDHTKTKIKITPNKYTKKMSWGTWGIAENLPNIKQSDFLKSFLQINGLILEQNPATKIIEFKRIEEKLTTDLSLATDLTNLLSVQSGYNINVLGNTFAKRNTYNYKKDSTVSRELSYTFFANNLLTNAEKNIFTLPFAPSDDLISSKNEIGGFNDAYDFSDSLNVAILPLCDDEGFIVNKIEPRILLLNFFPEYGSPNVGEELFGEFEPPLHLNAIFATDDDPVGTRPTWVIPDNITTATFKQYDVYKYSYYTSSLEIQELVENAYKEYNKKIPTTITITASFALNAEIFKRLRDNRIIKITKGYLQGYWYINKMSNFTDSSRVTDLELQKI